MRYRHRLISHVVTIPEESVPYLTLLTLLTWHLVKQGLAGGPLSGLAR